MILNNETLLCDQQAITASAASTNVQDFGLQGTPYGDAAGLTYDLGIGEELPLMFQVTEAFDSGANDGTLTVAWQMDTTTTFTPDSTVDLGTYTEAELTTGFKFPFDKIPRNTKLRYGRLYFTVGGSGNFTAGKITAGIGYYPQSN